MSYLAFPLLGLGSGAVYAALALGLVLTYRGSRVVNFAYGAMAMYTTLVFVELRDSGDFVQPVVGLPARIHLADSLPFGIALVLALLFAAGLGLVAWLLVFRPLRQAPPLAKVVASVGLMLTLQALAVLRFGAANRPLRPILPSGPLHLLGVVVPRDRLYLAGLTAIVALALWAGSRFTRLGLALRALAEDEQAVAVVGYSPQALAAFNWVAAGILAGLAGILASPITGLDPASSTLLIVPALAAALVGRLSSFGWTLAAGLVLGMAQAEITKVQSTFSWVPQLGLKEGLPLVVIVVVVTIAGARLPGRGDTGGERLPRAGIPRRPGLVALGGGIAASVALVVIPAGYRSSLVTSIIGALVCLSFVVLTGYVGQISLAQMALVGVAGFTLSKLATDLHVPFPLAPLLAAGAAVGVGLLLGVPSLRVRGLLLAVVSLAAAVALDELVFGNAAVTGGFAGSRVPSPALFGWDLGVGRGLGAPRLIFGFLALGVLVAGSIVVANLRRSPTGRQLLAVRANERAAASLAVDVVSAKLRAFALSAFLAGLAGALVGYQEGRLSFESFDVFASLGYLAVAYIGGIAVIAGAFVAGALVPGGLVFTALERLAGLGRYELLVTGLTVVVIAIVRPQGVAARAVRRSAATARTEITEPEPSRDAFVPRGRRRGSSHPVLVTEGLSVRFGGLVAVGHVSLRLEAGEIVGLVGPNGAGKTALLDALSGFVPASGSVMLENREVSDLPPHERARLGLARTFQGGELFDDLSVEENVVIGAERAGWGSLARDLVSRPQGPPAAAGEALRVVGLDDRSEVVVGDLPYHARCLVSVARALASRPSVLLLDEPAAGLDAGSSHRLMSDVRRIAAEGVAVLLVDHDIELVLGGCDRVVVLESGVVLADGAPDEIRRDPRVVAAYLGMWPPPDPGWGA